MSPERIRYQDALRLALRDAMAEDDNVFVVGEDVQHALRGVTAGLVDSFGEGRVLDAPLAEQGFTSFATGAALSGMRPVVEYQIPALAYIAFEQIVNQAQKFHLMTGGQANVPVTYLIPGSGARKGLAGQHSDNPYQFFVHAGVTTVVPATPQDAYSLFKAAIQFDDPVAVFAPAASLGQRALVDRSVRERIGEARVVRSGTDVTLASVGHLLPIALKAAESVEATGVSIEVVDVRTVFPLDRQTLIDSVEKTGRLVAVDDTNRSGGFSAEVIASVIESCQGGVVARRVVRDDVVMPFSPVLEEELVPNLEKVVQAIEACLVSNERN